MFSEMTSEMIIFNHLSSHSGSTALGTRIDYWKPTRRGTDETHPVMMVGVAERNAHFSK